ncbi:hypothetical protein O6H91_03G008200 [Diphasiastrum complanatum]|uniref:Uncharacterized protein n=1 Tax=Diphasiastrum complanatum TaxID=34168 RepID=A0ACC2E3A5_DIPCM|nr:hypothetical protein O6H91_03G008200 [Diphasiastrum complanatum]
MASGTFLSAEAAATSSVSVSGSAGNSFQGSARGRWGSGRGGRLPAVAQASGDGQDSGVVQRVAFGSAPSRGSFCSLAGRYPARGSISSEFCGKRSTRFVSKFNLGRQKAYIGEHTVAADMALHEIIQSPGSSTDLSMLLDTMVAKNRLNSKDFRYVLHELGNKGEWQKAMKSFDWMMRCGPSKHECSKLSSIIISTLGRLGKVNAAEEIFEKVQAAGFRDNVYVYSAMISVYGRSGRCEKALHVFCSMKKKGCKPNLITYNSVIDACGKGGFNFTRKALEIFEEMLRQSVEPDRITFNSLIAACSRWGLWMEAQSLLTAMQQRAIAKDIFTYNTVVDALCKGNQLSLAASVLAEMRSQLVNPNVVTYSTLIDGYAKAGCLEEAVSLHQEMKDAGIGPDRVLFNTLLHIYAKLGRLDEALDICQQMEKATLKKDVVTYNALIDAYGKQGNPKEAANLFAAMKNEGLVPNILTYSALIDSYCKFGLLEEATKLFQECWSSGLKPDVVLYSTLIDAYCKAGLVEESVILLKEMAKEGIQPNVVTCNSLISAYGRKTQGASTRNNIEDFFEIKESRGNQGTAMGAVKAIHEMQEYGVKPNVVTFSTILTACSHCASLKEASLVLSTMRLFDNGVYSVAHGLLMGALNAIWHKAEQLFDQMMCMDHSTARSFYNALADFLWQFGQREGARRIVAAAKQRQVWENAWQFSEQQMCLDLHLMSVGAAQAMLHLWLLYIYALFAEGQKSPELMSILTGWGKHSRIAGSSTVKQAIATRLSELGAPFRVTRYNDGRFVSTKNALALWFQETRSLKLLILHDIRASTYEMQLTLSEQFQNFGMS